MQGEPPSQPIIDLPNKEDEQFISHEPSFTNLSRIRTITYPFVAFAILQTLISVSLLITQPSFYPFSLALSGLISLVFLAVSYYWTYAIPKTFEKINSLTVSVPNKGGLSLLLIILGGIKLANIIFFAHEYLLDTSRLGLIRGSPIFLDIFFVGEVAMFCFIIMMLSTSLRFIQQPQRFNAHLTCILNILLVSASVALVFTVKRNINSEAYFRLSSLSGHGNFPVLMLLGVLCAIMTIPVWLVTHRQWRMASLVLSILLFSMALPLLAMGMNSKGQAKDVYANYKDAIDSESVDLRRESMANLEIEAFKCLQKYPSPMICSDGLPIIGSNGEGGFCLNKQCAGIYSQLYITELLENSQLSLITALVVSLTAISLLFSTKTIQDIFDGYRDKRSNYKWLAFVGVAGIMTGLMCGFHHDYSTFQHKYTVNEEEDQSVFLEDQFLQVFASATSRTPSQIKTMGGSRFSEKPVSDYKLHLVDIHWLSGKLNEQYIAHHFCGFPYEGFMICELFNGPDKTSRPIGVEYFITKDLFEALPEEEKVLWHSHPYEILSGLFVVMDVTPEEEKVVLEWIMGTYGKVTDTWQFYKDMPIGTPQLGFALALDSQVDWDLADEMDKILNLSTTHKERRAQRATMKVPEKAKGADAYLETKKAPQYNEGFIQMKDVEKYDPSLPKKTVVSKFFEDEMMEAHSRGPSGSHSGTKTGKSHTTSTISQIKSVVTETITDPFSKLKTLGGSKFQDKPISDYKLHLVDIHWLSGKINEQYIAHHFCGFPYDGFMICELFNGPDKTSRPIGVEYFITKDLFEKLPEEEKVLWHSHPYEILSGLFVVMDVTPEEEKVILEWIMGTYGKVTDTWQFYKDMPIGAPQLGFALALDSQVDWDLADEMDRILNLPTTHKERRAQRTTMKVPDKAKGADAYLKTKKAPQYDMGFIQMKDVETYDKSLVKKVLGKVEKISKFLEDEMMEASTAKTQAIANAFTRTPSQLKTLGGSKFQDKPISDYKLHLVDIHWLSGKLNEQYIAHHFCGFPYEGFMICELFNGPNKTSRPIGVEYFITKDLFEALPEEEKVLWHSHPYEILSGLFVVMDVTPEEEKVILEWIMGTYGKVTDTWQFYKDMPIGAPQLGFALALDSQVDWDLADEMDKILNLPDTHKERRARRVTMTIPEKAKGADAYLKTKQAPQYNAGFIQMKDVETYDGSLAKKALGKFEKKIMEQKESKFLEDEMMEALTKGTLNHPAPPSPPSHSATASELKTLGGSKFQDKPISDYKLHLVDIHWLSGKLNEQYIAHHFCGFPYDGFMICELFNGPNKTSRPIGVEYFITKDLFEALPEEEKVLWHSHPYEILSGLFVVMDVTPEEEKVVLEWIMGTYGKVTDTWQFYKDMPIGTPQLGFALALDSQVDWDLADEMDKILNLPDTHKERRARRVTMKMPEKAKGADAYLKTKQAPQYDTGFIQMKDVETYDGSLVKKALGKVEKKLMEQKEPKFFEDEMMEASSARTESITKAFTRTPSQLKTFGGSRFSEKPVSDYKLHLVDIHWLSGKLNEQYIAHHFCGFPYEGFMICELFNGPDKTSRPIGVEYFITKDLFEALPEEEKVLWHSHPYEILSGLFVVMDVTPEEEKVVLEWIMGTYGKVTDTWQFYKDMPIGTPQLGFALALDSQVDWDLADEMDKILNLSTTHKERRARRVSMKVPEKAKGADAYLETKKAPQYNEGFIQMKDVEKYDPSLPKKAAVSKFFEDEMMEASVRGPQYAHPTTSFPISYPIISSTPSDIKKLGSSKFQDKPISDYKLHLVDIHWLSGKLNEQYIAHHFCGFPYDGFMICELFNGPNKTSRPIGVEYFITKDLFESLPKEEKVLWHSHPYEILSGLFVVMDVTPDEEKVILEWIMGTYGKVTDTWQFYKDMPIGTPQLGFALALDSQVDWDLADEMDRILNLPTTHKERRAQRTTMKVPDKAKGADAYLETKQAPQYDREFIQMKDVENYDKSLVKKVLGKVEKIVTE